MMTKHHSKLLQCFLAVFILFSTVTSTALAEMACFDLFSEILPDPIERLIRFEEELRLFEAPIFAPGASPEQKILRSLISEITELKNRAETIFLNLENQPDVNQQLDINSLFASLNELRNKVSPSEKIIVPTQVSQLIEDPSKVKADFFYEVKGIDPFVERVIFSEDVVNGLFHNMAATYQHAAIHSLKAIQRGKVGHSEVGITPYTVDTSVYKVRFSGDGGNIRIAGFLSGRDFYAIAWSVDSKHDTHVTNRLVAEVNRIRRQMRLQ